MSVWTFCSPTIPKESKVWSQFSRLFYKGVVWSSACFCKEFLQWSLQWHSYPAYNCCDVHSLQYQELWSWCLSFRYCLVYFLQSNLIYFHENLVFRVFWISSSFLFPPVAKIRTVGAVLGIHNLNTVVQLCFLWSKVRSTLWFMQWIKKQRRVLCGLCLP